MERVLAFLRLLHDNNNRVWFNAHKSEYLEVKQIFEEFALSLLKGIRGFDPSIGELDIKDITYRIYRDTRFSKDKTPYKEHIGVYICRGGKKSGYSGYYFQISAADRGGWEVGHLCAIGDYMCEPKVLKVLREDIDMGGGDFREALSKADPRLSFDASTSLKRVPKGFREDSPEAEYLKLRNYCLCMDIDEKTVVSESLKDELLKIFSSARPFLQYVNRAIEYVKEGNE